tara:strand:- start:55650 stop:57893 length:2244 start_codon:yes stop_codon:yes gene_type:complete
VRSLDNEIKKYLQEAARDAKILRNINIDHIKKEEPKGPDEEVRDYFARIQQMERDPEYLNPIFPQGLVDWVESLPDNHFPTNGRKRFAKWLGNTIYHQETEVQGRLNTVDNPEELRIYNNDIRYIADYLNGADEFPEDLWDRSLNGMYDLAVEWHDTLKYKEDPTGDYESKDIVYSFDNGFTIVDVNTEADIRTEGDKMGHCVGSYCDAVAAGQMDIYSLRDKKNKPHVTIEVQPTLPLGRTRSSGRVMQIKGFGNSKPKDKYRVMVLQWLNTTDFEYKNSPDYLNLLSQEEIVNKLFAGELKKETELNMMSTSEEPEVLNFFIEQLIAQSRVIKASNQGIINNLVRNPRLNIEQRIKLLKTNLQLEAPYIGTRALTLLGLDGHNGRLPNIDIPMLQNRAYQELKDEMRLFKRDRPFRADVAEEMMYYLESFMKTSHLEMSAREEILEYLTSEEFMETATGYGVFHKRISMPYGAIMQEYLFSKAPTQENVRKLYMLMRSENFQELMDRTDRIANYIAKSIAMSDDLVVQIIKDKKSGKNQFNQRILIDMVMNPKIKDSLKIQLLNVKYPGEDSIMDLVTLGKYRGPYKDGGIYWTVSGRSYSRQLVRAAEDGQFSDKLVKYMIDAGVFDPEYAQILAGKESKRTGRRPGFESMVGAQKQAALEKIRKMANDDFDNGKFSDEIFEQELNRMDALQEDIKVYLNKKTRPFGNTEDIEPEDALVIEQWISELQEDGISDLDKGGMEVGL